MNTNNLLKIGGSALSLLSAMTLAGYAVSGKRKAVSPSLPILCTAGLVTGTAMIVYSHLAAKKNEPTPEEDLMDDEDIALIRQNINEVLGGE